MTHLISFATQRDQNTVFQIFWCGVLTDCGTVWRRHGCRRRAYKDVLAAYPASAEGTAHSTQGGAPR
ncbi:hypothetical protein, partial [Xanthomonas arboricola]|uniref:hypothetical protein n=1 Tax=Xanthomonas arboricola TaxID=56448 RepID=UPI001C611E06